jgi:hypothetical protein
MTMQSTNFIPLRVIVAALLGGTFAIAANILSFLMIGKINEIAPENEQISYLRWGTEVRKRYKEFFPASKLPLLVNICFVLMLVSFVFLVRFWVFGSTTNGN